MDRTVEQQLFEEGYAFDFFQAVRLLEKLEPARRPVGKEGPPGKEIVRFRVHQSLSFPPSSIYELNPPVPPGVNTPGSPVPAMTVTFMGLTGVNGVLPRHYTEIILHLRELKTPEQFALRDWFDLFNHRIISLFYRAWDKYRFYLAYERGDFVKAEPDPFTRCLFSFVGLGMPPLRNRLRIAVWQPAADQSANFETPPVGPERLLARVDDFVLLFYGGFLSHRPRCAISLEAMLGDYFRLPIQVQQFQGQWLQLEPANQSSLDEGSNNCLGMNVVAGERVWDVQSKIRVRLGPLAYNLFTDFLPDRSPSPERKAFFLLSHLVRLYLGDELDYDVQLVLAADEVPELQLADGGLGPRLGWNTWISSGPMPQDADDVVFEGDEMVLVNAHERPPILAGAA